jgi:hypothetical protein
MKGKFIKATYTESTGTTETIYAVVLDKFLAQSKQKKDVAITYYLCQQIISVRLHSGLCNSIKMDKIRNIHPNRIVGVFDNLKEAIKDWKRFVKNHDFQDEVQKKLREVEFDLSKREDS